MPWLSLPALPDGIRRCFVARFGELRKGADQIKIMVSGGGIPRRRTRLNAKIFFFFFFFNYSPVRDCRWIVEGSQNGTRPYVHGSCLWRRRYRGRAGNAGVRTMSTAI